MPRSGPVWLPRSLPMKNMSIRSPASSSADARWSTTTRARQTVADGISITSGRKEPMALTCAPGCRSPSSKTGAVDVVAVQTTSASFRASVGVPVRFRQPFTSIWMDAAVMSTRIRRVRAHADCPSDVDAREAYLELGPASDPICQLEQVIDSVLSHPRVSVRLTASIIGTSARTLQRRLTNQGTSFSRLLQAVRFRKGQQLLEDPKMPLREIAKRMSYTDLANFMRAFKRWTGVDPSQFRRLHCEPGHE